VYWLNFVAHATLTGLSGYAQLSNIKLFNMKTKNSIWIPTMIFLILALLINNSCKKSSNNYSPGDATVLTTIDRTIVPDFVPVIPAVRIDDPANFAKYGYGTWHWGPGIPCQKRIDLMPSGYDYATVAQAAQLLRFFTITDIHITDKESPCQAIFFAPYAGENGISCYAPLMLYTTQMLDAAIQTINKLHKQKSFDLGLSLGDMANCSQYNELRWFIDVMDGQTITPSSGVQKPGTNNHYQDSFKAAGLDPSIPWYATLGNHDHFWMGSKPVDAKIQHALVGDSILQLGDIFNDPNAMTKKQFSTGTLDGSTEYGTIIGCGVVANMGTIPTVSPDQNRHAITIPDFMNQFGTTTSQPKGHGFIQTNPANQLGASYSFVPKSSVPLKIIVLDDTQDASEAPYEEGVYGHGELTADRYNWLMAQLKAGQDANQLMIISAHIPIGVAAQGSPMDWKPVLPGYSSEKDLIAQLQSFPNLILWVCGHRHLNNVTAFPSADQTHPENSFWEVETKSLREFPEQFRTFDIVRNSDNTISIITTDVDAETKTGSLAAIGRSYAIASNQIYKMYGQPLETGSVSYNAELIKQLSPVMQEKIKNLGTPVKK
jgi:metallophosphoesterase (TIGR03768 family)